MAEDGPRTRFPHVPGGVPGLRSYAESRPSQRRRGGVAEASRSTAQREERGHELAQGQAVRRTVPRGTGRRRGAGTRARAPARLSELCCIIIIVVAVLIGGEHGPPDLRNHGFLRHPRVHDHGNRVSNYQWSVTGFNNKKPDACNTFTAADVRLN